MIDKLVTLSRESHAPTFEQRQRHDNRTEISNMIDMSRNSLRFCFVNEVFIDNDLIRYVSHDLLVIQTRSQVAEQLG